MPPHVRASGTCSAAPAPEASGTGPTKNPHAPTRSRPARADAKSRPAKRGFFSPTTSVVLRFCVGVQATAKGPHHSHGLQQARVRIRLRPHALRAAGEMRHWRPPDARFGEMTSPAFHIPCATRPPAGPFRPGTRFTRWQPVECAGRRRLPAVRQDRSQQKLPAVANAGCQGFVESGLSGRRRAKAAVQPRARPSRTCHPSKTGGTSSSCAHGLPSPLESEAC